MSEEGNLLHIPGFIITVSSQLFSEIKNTYLEGKELGSINNTLQATCSVLKVLVMSFVCQFYLQAPNQKRKYIKELQFVVNDFFIITMTMAYRAVWRAGTNFVPGAVPAHLENPTSAPVAVHQGSSLKQQRRQINDQLCWHLANHDNSAPLLFGTVWIRRLP